MDYELDESGVEASIHPSGTNLLITKVVGPWVVEMRWDPNQDKATGPSSLLIRANKGGWADDDDAEVARGINSGTLRRAEHVLTQATAEWRSTGVGPVVDRLSVEYGEALADLREHPLTEDREGYYRALNRASVILSALGDRTPNKSLAAMLDLPPETVRTQLKKARKRAAEQGSV